MPKLDEKFWQKHFEDVLDMIVSIWLDVMWSSALYVMEVMNDAGMPGIDESLVYSNVLDWISSNAPYEAALILETSRQAVEKALELWDGKDKNKLRDLLEPIFGNTRAETIGITEAMIAAAIGNLLGWQAYGIIEEVIWMTAADERVCPICAPRHETVIRLGDALYGGERPPAHPRCRCWLEAILIISKNKTLAEALFSGKVSLETLEEIAYVVQY